MSIDTPTTKAVASNIIAQLESTLNQTIPLMPKAVNRVLSQAIAMVFMTLYKFAGWIFLQMFVRTASNTDFIINGHTVNPLQELGILVGVGNSVAATQAVLEIEITVTTQTGVILSGAQMTSTSNNVTYLTLSTVTLDAATKTVNVKAVSDPSGGGGAGTIGNLENGLTITFVNVQPNVSQITTVTDQITTGADAETTASYRQRILDRFQRRPQGGAYVDYGLWSSGVPGILGVYPYTGLPGEVDVYVESSTEVDGIPTQAQLDDVYDAIQLDENGLATHRPAGSFVNVYPITRLEFDCVVSGVQSVDDLAQTQSDITAGIEQYMLQRAPYIPGYTSGVKYNNITRTGVSAVVEGIIDAAGGIFSSVSITLNTVGVSVYSLDEGEKAKSGAVTFI